MAKMRTPQMWQNKGRYKRHLDRKVNGEGSWTPGPRYGDKYPKDARLEKQRVKTGGGGEDVVVTGPVAAASSTPEPAPIFGENHDK